MYQHQPDHEIDGEQQATGLCDIAAEGALITERKWW
jgi:hypothetical protein